MSRPSARGGWALAVLVASLAGVARAAAQGAAPLQKTDLIRLLATPLIAKGEVADLIRRNCLAFHPSERDWADFRREGADADILGSIGACTERARVRAAAAAAPLPLQAVAFPARVVTPAGGDATVRVLVTRGERVQAGVALVLRDSARAGADSASRPEAVTDESGVAQFRFSVGAVAGTHTLRVALPAGSDLPGRPAVEVVVQPGAPVDAQVEPARLDLDRGGPLEVAVALLDSFGNPVPGEPVALAPTDEAMGLLPATERTDSLGRAQFALEPHAVRRGGAVHVVVRGDTLASLEAVFTEPASDTASGFLPGDERAGVAGMALDAPVAFRVRGRSGRALPGRVVAFAAHNATVAPVRAVTDSQGLARVRVTLGTKAGTAVLTATVDSVQRGDTLHVRPGPATAVVIERNDVRVDGGQVRVSVDSSFVLAVSARDGYDNPAPIGALARALDQTRAKFNRSSRLLRLVDVTADRWTALVTFRPLARGTGPLTLAGATVVVDVVGGAAAAH
jgi:hypothetical protein